MISCIRGQLVRLDGTTAVVRVGPVDLEVWVAERVRMKLQDQVGREIELRTRMYLEGSANSGRLVPRIVGFLEPVELEFFELFAGVNGLGPRKALQAMRWPVSQLASAIYNGDVDLLSSLPGIGKATAEKIVASLRRSVKRFLSAIEQPVAQQAGLPKEEIELAFRALLQLGYGEAEARELLQQALEGGQRYESVQALLNAVFRLAAQR